MRLTHSNVLRSGVTARYWSHGTDEVDLASNPKSLSIRFRIDSKGGGETEIELNIRPKDFPALLRAMSDTNREATIRSEEHTSELQSRLHLVCRLLLEKKKKQTTHGELTSAA